MCPRASSSSRHRKLHPVPLPRRENHRAAKSPICRRLAPILGGVVESAARERPQGVDLLHSGPETAGRELQSAWGLRSTGPLPIYAGCHRSVAARPRLSLSGRFPLGTMDPDTLPPAAPHRCWQAKPLSSKCPYSALDAREMRRAESRHIRPHFPFCIFIIRDRKVTRAVTPHETILSPCPTRSPIVPPPLVLSERCRALTRGGGVVVSFGWWLGRWLPKPRTWRPGSGASRR